jgi:hypothetical protein
MQLQIRENSKKFLFVLIPLLLIVSGIAFLPVTAQSSTPRYAVAGANAMYQVLGGMIPFFDGVNGTIEYTVSSVFSNGSMAFSISGNVSQGNEVPVSNFSYGYVDSYVLPKIFPAINPSMLTQSSFHFENVSCTFSRNDSVTVPAGSFNTMEYTGPNVNGTTTYYWFDPTTGLVIQMAAGGGVFQLQSSNIATPYSTPTGLATSLPFLEVFGGAFGLGAVIFVGLWIFYNKRGKKNGSVSTKPNTMKGQKVASERRENKKEI